MSVVSSHFEQALDELQRTKRHMPFEVSEVAEAIQTISGQTISAADHAEIKTLLRRKWGNGVEPAAIGDNLWKFGWGRPPVSREIRR